MLGIIGGMGIEAGQAFDALVRSFGVNTTRSDKTHPCRVAWLEGRGESPAQSISNTIESLQEQGASKFVLACNTAHAVWAELADMGWGDKLIHMVDETVQRVRNSHALWLGTTVLGHSTNLVRRGGIMLPGDKAQEAIQQAIWDAKVGKFTLASRVAKICHDFDTVVAGCTEMPLILERARVQATVINPAAVVATVAGGR